MENPDAVVSVADLDRLDEVRQMFPERIARRLDDVLNADDPTLRCKHLLTAVEELTQYLARLLANEYASRGGAPLPRIDAKWLTGLAFGSYRAIGQEVLGGLAGPWSYEGFAPLGQSRTPDAIGRFCSDMPVAWKALERGTPPSGILGYIDDAKSSGGGAVPLYTFLNTVVMVRNSEGHKAGDGSKGKPWSEDPGWSKLVVRLLEPAVMAVLLWPPLTRILTEIEVVTAIGESQWANQRWTTPVKRDFNLPTRVSALSSTSPLATGCDYLVPRTGRSLGAVLFRCRPVAELASESIVVAATAAKAQSLSSRAAAKERFLSSILTGIGVGPDEALVTDAVIQDECWREIEAQLPKASDDAEGPSAGAAPSPEGREQAVAEWWERLRVAVDGLLLNATDVVTAADLGNTLKVSAIIVERYLEELCRKERLIPAGSKGSQLRVFQVPPTRQVVEYQAILDDITSDAKANRHFWSGPRTVRLLQLVYSLLPPLESIEDIDVSLFERAAGGEASARSAVAASGRGVAVLIDGAHFDVVSRVDFYRAVFQRFGLRSEFAESLPWTWSRKRRLADTNPTATESRSEMSYPVPLPDGAKPAVYFDAQATAEEAAYCAVQHLRKARMTHTEIVVEFPPSGQTVESVLLGGETSTALEGPAVGLIVVIPEEGGTKREETVAGSTVELMLAAFLKLLVDNSWIKYESLPIRLARSRLFISLRPDHGAADSPFGRALSYQGVYLESQLSVSDAVNAAIKACEQCGLSARSLAEETEDEVDSPSGEGEDIGPQVWHLNIGGRSEGDMLRLGFWEAGGARRYRAIVERLTEGDTVYLYRNGAGYVAAGVVTGGAAERLETFIESATIAVDATTERYAGRYAADGAPAPEDEAEYVRAIDWRWQRPERPVRLRDFIPGWIAPFIAGCRLRQPEVQTNLAREFGIESGEGVRPERLIGDGEGGALGAPDGTVMATREGTEPA